MECSNVKKKWNVGLEKYASQKLVSEECKGTKVDLFLRKSQRCVPNRTFDQRIIFILQGQSNKNNTTNNNNINNS